MSEEKFYDKFPAWIVFLANVLSIGIYAIGLYVCYQWHWIVAVIFLLYILLMEYRLIGKHCINCYYYGKVCGFGKGWFSAKLFKQGSIEQFCAKETTWKDMLPDMLVMLIPFILGIIRLIIDFNLFLLICLIVLLLLTSAGNSFVRGNLTCKYCKQRKLGCPAEKLFNKETK